MIKRRVLRKVGGSVMLALPPAMRRHLGGGAGTEVSLMAVDGGVLITRYTREMARTHDVLEHLHARAQNGLRRLVTPPP